MQNNYHRTKSVEDMKRDLAEKATQTETGVYHWKSNGSVPPDECLWMADVSDELRKINETARDIELAKFAAQYRERMANLTPEEEAERAFELRAAFGPGEVVVNVITGKRTIT